MRSGISGEDKGKEIQVEEVLVNIHSMVSEMVSRQGGKRKLIRIYYKCKLEK